MAYKGIAVLWFGVAFFAGSEVASAPSGLWQNKEEGFVVRIEACGQGFCGFAAGVPRGGKQKREDMCGKLILKNFVWSSEEGGWKGQMQPPEENLSIHAHLVTDGKTYLTLHAHKMLLSKTMKFVPFRGQITNDCQQLPSSGR